MRRAAIAILVALAPHAALACPVCARDGTPSALLIVGGMIAAPYVVAALVIRAIRSGDGEP